MDGWQVPTSNGSGSNRRLVTALIVGWTVLIAAVEYMEYAKIGATNSADIGISIAIGMVVLFIGWLIGFIVLSVVWFSTKPTADGP